MRCNTTIWRKTSIHPLHQVSRSGMAMMVGPVSTTRSGGPTVWSISSTIRWHWTSTNWKLYLAIPGSAASGSRAAMRTWVLSTMPSRIMVLAAVVICAMARLTSGLVLQSQRWLVSLAVWIITSTISSTLRPLCVVRVAPSLVPTRSGVASRLHHWHGKSSIPRLHRACRKLSRVWSHALAMV